MIALISVFYASLLLIAALLLEKRLELSSGRKFFFTRLSEGSDHFFEKAAADARRAVSYFNKHTFIAFVQWLAAGILSALRDLYIKLFHIARRYPHSKKVIDMVRGEGEVGTQGDASFFLKKISEASAPASPSTTSEAAE